MNENKKIIGVLCTQRFFNYYFKGKDDHICISKQQDLYGRHYHEVIETSDEGIRKHGYNELYEQAMLRVTPYIK